LENLFDTIKDKGKDDFEYLPTSQTKWNTERYTAKLHHLSRSIANIGDWEGPDILGVCEVEHKSCLIDLTQKTALKQFNYGVIHQESDDQRGIDVACIYKKDRFELIDYRFHKIHFEEKERATRDILYVKGRLPNNDTIHLFFNHWPSRMGGQAISEPKRFAAANKLSVAIDSILIIEPNAKIIITGDFNDSPSDISINHYLKASHTINNNSNHLFNTSYYLQNSLQKGTHKYQDEWNLLDQIIVSSTLMDTNNSTFCQQKDSKIHDDKAWLKETDSFSIDSKPKRTFIGTQYNNGYSDHYAVSIRLWFR
jgi:hypothetical protein